MSALTDLEAAALAYAVAQGYTAPASYLFSDDFTGQTLDPTKWDVITAGGPDGGPVRAGNVFQDGQGNLVVRASRSGSAFVGGFVGTFAYGSGWPPLNVKGSWPVPFRLDVRARMPNTPGAHAGIWLMNTDRTQAQTIYELDVAEERMSQPTVAGSHQHAWLNGKDTDAQDATLTVSNMASNWHVYSSEVHADHVTDYVDGQAVGTFYGVTGHFGLLLSCEIDPAGSWGAAGGQPAASDPGPWDMLVDYVHVSAL